MQQNNEPHDRLHELLCKVIFGEATADEIAEVETALETSPELRAQKAEIEGTVALVRGACAVKSDDTLSNERFDAVVAAANSATPPAGVLLGGEAWFRRPFIRTAAVVAIIAGTGGFWWNSRGAPTEEGADATTVASAGASAAPWTLNLATSGGARPELENFDLRGIGSPGQDTYVGQPFVEFGLEAREVEAEPPSISVLVADLDTTASGGSTPGDSGNKGGTYRGPGDSMPPGGAAAGLSTSVPFVATVPPLVRDTAGLGGEGSETRYFRSSPGPSGPPTYRKKLEAAQEIGLDRVRRVTPGSPAPEEPAPITDGLRELGYGAPALDSKSSRGLSVVDEQLRRSGGTASEPDDFFLGRGQADQPRRAGETWGRVTTPPTRLPNELPRDMFFRFWGDNPFVISARDALSTFAADVDTASFTLARRMLREGHLPPRAQVRTEEFVNFAKPDLAPPTEGTFAIHGELAPSPFGGREDRWLLRIGVRAAVIERDARPPLALTFVVDTSGSMRQGNRLELVKHAIRLLVGELDARDSIAIVRFSNQASEVLQPTSAAARDVIETALFQLQPGGSTNAEAGLKLGYGLAEQMLLPGVQTRVVFLSDGVANVGETDQARIANDVAASASRGIFLNTIGVGMGNHNDVFLEQMANKGQGVCDYIGDAADAHRAIVERFVGNFVTVAKDVKIQVEFDPSQVLRWRQLGYENRAVADKDFRNDAIDAGEIGAGHQVVCLYEIELPSGSDHGDAPLATVRLRWKPVATGEAQPLTEAVEIERALTYDSIVAASFRAASIGFRRAALAAQLAECLRRSTHARGDSMRTLGKELAQLLSEDRAEDTAMIAEMTKHSIDLGLEAQLPAPIAGDPEAQHREAYYDALIDSLGGADDAMSPGSDQLSHESRIKALLERDFGQQGR